MFVLTQEFQVHPCSKENQDSFASGKNWARPPVAPQKEYKNSTEPSSVTQESIINSTQTRTLPLQNSLFEKDLTKTEVPKWIVCNPLTIIFELELEF